MSPRRVAGFTLVELMIALTIGLFLVGAMLTVLLSAGSTGRTRERAADVQTNGRYAIDLIKRDLQHAGFQGGASTFYPDAATSISIANVCDATNAGRLSQRVWGMDDANPFSATCIPAASYARGDVLVVRRLSTGTAVAPLAGNVVYYRSAFEGGGFFLGPTYAGPERRAPYSDYVLEESVYYVSPWTESPSETPRVPALYRVRLSPGPAMTPELVAAGVENMQVRYGRFDAANRMQYFDASSGTPWDSISSVRVSLLVRSATTEPGYTNGTTYDLGNQRIAVNDAYRRLEFSTVVQLRN